MKRVLFVAFALMIGGMFNLVRAQDGSVDNHTINFTIPQVTLLDIEPSTSTSFSFAATAPTEAGDSLSFAGNTNTSLWLNYTSIRSGSGIEREITAALNVGAPENTTLKVTAGAPTGFGGLGTSNGQLTLTTTAQAVISDITSCYTRNGANRGSNLSYLWELTAASGYGSMYAVTATPVVVTYTLKDE